MIPIALARTMIRHTGCGVRNDASVLHVHYGLVEAFQYILEQDHFMVDVKAKSDLGLSVANEYLRCVFSATSAKSYGWHCQMARTYRICQSSAIAKIG